MLSTCAQYEQQCIKYQRRRPRGTSLHLEAPQGQLTMSLISALVSEDVLGFGLQHETFNELPLHKRWIVIFSAVQFHSNAKIPVLLQI